MSLDPVLPQDDAGLPPPMSFLFRDPRSVPSDLERFFSLRWLKGPKDWSEIRASVRHQGAFPFCTSYAAATLFEAYYRRQGQDAASFSPPFLHRCVGGSDDRQGLDPLDLMDAILPGRTIPPWTNPLPWPRGQCGPQAGLPLLGLRSISGDSAARDALATSPVVAGMNIDPTFRNLRGRFYQPSPPTDVADHHSVCILAKTDYGWLIQNSFGEGWGENGFCEVPAGAGGLLRTFSAVALV